MKKTIFLTLMTLLVFLLSLQAQQTRKVSGKVVDLKTGETLIGVSIIIKGSTKTTITDYDGNYSIEVPDMANDTLVFSYIGYQAMQEPVNNRTYITVQMNSADQQLSEVIIIGYGTQKKQSVIGSISSISNKTLVTAPVSNISQSLAGKLSGIQVVQSSGEIGGDIADIYVR
jgi:hypothetical protein